MFCPNCGAPISEDQAYCSKCGAPLQNPNNPDPDTQYNPYHYDQAPFQPAPLKMKWYKFLIYFSLFLASITNLLSGIGYVTGLYYELYEIDSSYVYLYYGSALKVLDVVYGIAMIATAVLCIYTRSRLARFKENGPMCVYILYALIPIISAAYLVISSIIIGVVAIDFSTIISFAFSLGILALNVIYFNKRRHLFVN